MKNTIKNAKFRFLIYQKEKEVFVGICKETGYVEEGKSADEVLERLLNGTKAILEAVKENEQLTASLNFSPPLKYKILFYWIPFWFGIKNIFSNTQIELINKNINQLCEV